ncbi:MAG: hypothetical protein EA351_11125 [Gemmatimonadales bacterium]|nr:MAG: hypothetical protein EA351_11125 [Gemmatimonadales bacterium]
MTGPQVARRAGLEGTVRAYWSGESSRLVSALLSIFGAPLSVLFATGVRIRNVLYDRGAIRTKPPPIPVISVGNLAVGGTGKTPVSRWLVELLLARGQSPAIVSRGFGEDELLLHRRWHPDIPVIRAPRRIEGVRAAAARGCTVAVVDDGFQHRALGRSLDLVLLSPAHPLPIRLLPRGPFREPLRSLRRAHGVLVTVKSPAENATADRLLDEVRSLPGHPPARLLTLLPGSWCDLRGAPASAPDGPLLALTSVAQPGSFVSLVRARGLHSGSEGDEGVELLAFPDHHPYTSEELSQILETAGDRMVVTTEKDAVKLIPLCEEAAPSAMDRFRVLPLMISVGPRVEDWVQQLLDKALP